MAPYQFLIHIPDARSALDFAIQTSNIVRVKPCQKLKTPKLHSPKNSIKTRPFFPLLVIVLSSEPDQIHNLPLLKPNHKKELQHSRTQALPPSPSPTKSMNSIHPYTCTLSLSDVHRMLHKCSNCVKIGSMETAFSHAQLQKSCARSQMQQRERNAAQISTPPTQQKSFLCNEKQENRRTRKEANKQITRPFSHPCLYNPTCLPQEHCPRLFHWLLPVAPRPRNPTC